MDDMQAIEQRISREMSRRAGPSLPVDDLAVFEAITTTTKSQRWGFSMFSALKLAAAGVIVALFGGFLLAGVLTTPQDGEVLPAAVTESPSPTTDEMLSGMITEEVEPGVLRVINDGVRDLSSTDLGYPGHSVDITPDGDVWLSGDGLTFRLGDEAQSRFPDGIWPPYLEVAPDGSLWATSETAIYSLDGEEWEVQATASDGALRFGSLAIGPDGTVWAMDWTGMLLLRLEDDGTLARIEAGADVYSGLVSPDEIAVSPDGDVWLVGMVHGDGPAAEELLRFDGSEWEVIQGPEGFLNHPVGNSLDIGPDGTLWVNANDGGSGRFGVGGLARFDDPGWTSFTEADGVQNWGGQGFVGADLLAVAPDGSLWMNGTNERDCCSGVARYDGVTWDSYLVGSSVHDLAIAPDGSAWVRTSKYGMDGNPVGGVKLHVITPEASAAPEVAMTLESEATELPSAEERIDAEQVSMTTGELLADVVTEEIEPGVHRVVDDGVREFESGQIEHLVAGLDSSVWILDGAGFHRLGSEQPEDTRTSAELPPADEFSVGPDGTLWLDGTHWDAGEWEGLGSFDGASWTRHRPEDIPDGHRPWGLHVATDGSVWVLLAGRGEWLSATAVLARFDGDAWEVSDFVTGALPQLFATDSSSPWAVGSYAPTLHRFDGSHWQQHDTPSGFPGQWNLVVGPDDTLWSLVEIEPVDDWSSLPRALSFHDGVEWQRWDEDQFPIQDEGNLLWALQPLAAGPDGSLWSAVAWGSWVSPFSPDWSEPRCDGIARFDGETVSRYLEGLCVRVLDAAPDGSVWILAGPDDTAWDLYVVAPGP